MLRRLRIRRRRADERGAVAVMVAILLSVLLLAAAMTVDLGTQRALRSDLQGLVDIVAMDLSRSLTGGATNSYSASAIAAIDAEKVASVNRNKDMVGGAVPPSELSWTFVLKDPTTNEYRVAGATETPTAIKVAGRADVGFAFSGITGVAEGQSRRVGIAASTKRACVRVRSYVKEWNISNSWLGQALGGLMKTPAGEDVIVMFFDTETGMLDLNPPIGDVVDALDALVAQDLAGMSGTALSSTTVTLDVFLQAATSVVQAHGTAAQVALMTNLRSGIDPAKVTGGVRLGDVIDFGVDKTAALTMPINIADLVSAALVSATGTDSLAYSDLSGLSPTLPDGPQSMGITTKLSIAQKPVISCSGNANSSQMTFLLSGTLPTIPFWYLGVWYYLSAPISITVDTANLKVVTKNVTCLPDGTKRVYLDVDSSLFDIDIYIGKSPDVPGSKDFKFYGNLFTLATGTIHLFPTGAVNRTTLSTYIDIKGNDYTPEISIKPEGLGFPTMGYQSNISSIYGSAYADFVGQSITKVYNALSSGIDQWLLQPLLNAMGATFGGGSVRLVPTVDCGTPRLVG
ncbi:hypothetical protein E8D34_04620 [Nocardioides sp. GY 10113]|uniref:hypothetical protein n=1 Tax=Nocardioides sp. GY 10113 TaxID=2569761 RepID=UPI0010A9128E|nr:hypothetical protein [Nocardioides sp. GY 10113]TIC88231.1 hypothetical protein E8D34_04620 [Nocardioides sp. GY 10113]